MANQEKLDLSGVVFRTGCESLAGYRISEAGCDSKEMQIFAQFFGGNGIFPACHSASETNFSGSMFSGGI